MKEQDQQSVPVPRKTNDIVEGWVGMILAVTLVLGIILWPLASRAFKAASVAAGFN